MAVITVRKPLSQSIKSTGKESVKLLDSPLTALKYCFEVVLVESRFCGPCSLRELKMFSLNLGHDLQFELANRVDISKVEPCILMFL